jgi:hypothetical protein
MTTISEREKIAKLVLTTSDDAILDKIKALISASAKAKAAYVKKYNKEIDDAVARIKKGKFLTHEQVEALMEKW